MNAQQEKRYSQLIAILKEIPQGTVIQGGSNSKTTYTIMQEYNSKYDEKLGVSSIAMMLRHLAKNGLVGTNQSHNIALWWLVKHADIDGFFLTMRNIGNDVYINSK